MHLEMDKWTKLSDFDESPNTISLDITITPAIFWANEIIQRLAEDISAQMRIKFDQEMMDTIIKGYTK